MSEEILDRLLQRRAQLRDRLRQAGSDARGEAEPLSGDFKAPATQRERDEGLDRIGLSTQVELRQIDAALLRLRLGTYGICATCERAIEPERLRAVPYTVHCSQCAADETGAGG